jgi:hypothetical protein
MSMSSAGAAQIALPSGGGRPAAQEQHMAQQYSKTMAMLTSGAPGGLTLMTSVPSIQSGVLVLSGPAAFGLTGTAIAATGGGGCATRSSSLCAGVDPLSAANRGGSMACRMLEWPGGNEYAGRSGCESLASRCAATMRSSLAAAGRRMTVPSAPVARHPAVLLRSETQRSCY